MKVAVRKPRAHAPIRNARAVKQAPSQEHDLPVLAAEEAPAQRLDWEGLMRDGVQPALLVGGERRWQGRR